MGLWDRYILAICATSPAAYISNPIQSDPCESREWSGVVVAAPPARHTLPPSLASSVTTETQSETELSEMALNTSPPHGVVQHKPTTGDKKNNKDTNNNIISVSSASVSSAMLKAAKRFQEKLRMKGRKKKKKRTQSQSQSVPKPLKTSRSYKTQPLKKGKSYSSSSDRMPRERSLAEHRERNYVFDTKIGARNSRTGFKLRKYYRLGSQNTRRRRDRIYSVDSDSDQPDM